MKERNISGANCTRCKKFVSPKTGWLVKGGFGMRFVYHEGCYTSKAEEDKKKLDERLKAALRYPKCKKDSP